MVLQRSLPVILGSILVTHLVIIMVTLNNTKVTSGFTKVMSVDTRVTWGDSKGQFWWFLGQFQC